MEKEQFQSGPYSSPSAESVPVDGGSNGLCGRGVCQGCTVLGKGAASYPNLFYQSLIKKTLLIIF